MILKMGRLLNNYTCFEVDIRGKPFEFLSLAGACKKASILLQLYNCSRCLQIIDTMERMELQKHQK